MQRLIGNRAVTESLGARAAVAHPGVVPLQRSGPAVAAELTGHASPRWEHTGSASRAQLNLNLSQDRVDAVEAYVHDALSAMLHETGPDFQLEMQCRVTDDAPTGSVDATAVGHSQTQSEAGGEVGANNRRFRRVDIDISVTWTSEENAPMSVVREVTIPGEVEETRTNLWSVKMIMAGGAGHAGLGVAGGIGRLKNRRTGRVMTGFFTGGGLGVGLSSPGADPGWGEWVDFETDRAVTFADFDGALSRLTTAGAGVAVIGYGLAYLSFPMLGANSIDVGGFNMGAVGADMSTNVGRWTLQGDPSPRREPDRIEERGGVGHAPYIARHGNDFHHRVEFETGSARISDTELVHLQEFLDSVALNVTPADARETRSAR